MPRTLSRSVALLAPLLSLLLIAGNASAATWTSSEKFGQVTIGNYTIRNDVWGSGAGTQTIFANSGSNWGVTANHPNTGGVKSYPHSARAINRRLSATTRLASTFTVTVPNSGAYETAFDIWADNNAFEIMLWMNKTGAVGPLGTRQTTVTVGGHTWDAFRGSNGANAVFSFVRQGNTSSATVDIRAVLNWIRSQGWFGDVTVGEVQFGFEITSSAGGLSFTSNSYSVTAG
jgi:glycosyl hydrolase family 12